MGHQYQSHDDVVMIYATGYLLYTACVVDNKETARVRGTAVQRNGAKRTGEQGVKGRWRVLLPYGCSRSLHVLSTTTTRTMDISLRRLPAH
eukprot:6199259-Pleurochrysis_carterae.AAC.1